MYCSNCGKLLRNEDKYCSYCGKKMEPPLEQAPTAVEEIIFNPSFDETAKSQTEVDVEKLDEIELVEEAESVAVEETDEKSIEKNNEFVWNVYEFPSDEPKRTEDIVFRWDTSPEIELERESQEEEPAQEELAFPEELKIDLDMETQDLQSEDLKPEELQQEEPAPSLIEGLLEDAPEIVQEPEEVLLSEEELPPSQLEKDLFEDIQKQAEEAKNQAERIDRFYTFNKKNEEFQKLLDREYEKIHLGRKELEETELSSLELDEAILEPSAPEPTEDGSVQDFAMKTIRVEKVQSEEEDYTAFDPVSHIEEMEKERKAVSIDMDTEILDNDEIIRKFDTMELKKDTLGEGQEPPKPEEAPLCEKPEEKPEEKPFSRTQALDELFGKRFDEYEEAQKQAAVEEVEKKEKKSKASIARQILLIIVILLVLVELIILGIKYFAPESKATAFINDKLSAVADLFEKPDKDEQDKDAGVDEEEDQPPPVDTSPKEDKAALVDGQLFLNKNIESIVAEASLAYNPTEQYSVQAISESKPIENNLWYTKDTGTPVFYDESVVGTLIAFDSQWIDYVNNLDKAVLALTKEGSNAYKNSVAYKGVGKETKVFKLLQIGEIRQSATGFYVWAHEEIETTANGKTTKSEKNWIYYLEPLGQEMKIVDYYEFKK